MTPALALLIACSKDTPSDSDSAPVVQWPACAAPTLTPTQSLEPVREPASLSPHGSVGAALEDLDGDGDLDLALVTMEGEGLLYVNDGSGAFTVAPVTLPPATGLATGDMDGDGVVDLLLTIPNAPDMIAFTDGRTPIEFGDSEAEEFSIAVADMDGDGDLDVFTSAYNTALQPSDLEGGQGTGSRLYENQGDGSMVDVSARIPADVLDDVAFMAQWVDADGDGDLDLYTANDYGPYTGRNRLLLNDGSGQFSDATDCACDRAMYAMGVAVGDPTGDGLPELYVSNLGGPVLFSATGTGAFVDITAATGASVPNSADRLAGWGTQFVDLSGDGRDDVAMVFGTLTPGSDGSDAEDLDPSFQDGAAQRDLFMLATDQGFVEAPEAGFTDDRVGRDLLVGDLDGDGDPDLVSAGIWYVQTWHTESECQHVVVDLPPSAVGARVQAVQGERISTRWMLPASTWSTSASQVFLGLGPASEDTVSVTVTWPDGSTWTQDNVAGGSRLEPTW